MCPVPRAETVYRDVLRLAEWVGHRLTSSWISSSVQVLMSRHGGGRAVPASLSFEYSTPHRRPHRRCGLPWRVARRPRCSRRTGRRSLPLSSTRDGLVRYGPLVSPPGQALARYPMSVIDCCGRMLGHRCHRLVFAGPKGNALPIGKHEPLMTTNFPEDVFSHFGVR
jgi:hypothetical protein